MLNFMMFQHDLVTRSEGVSPTPKFMVEQIEFQKFHDVQSIMQLISWLSLRVKYLQVDSDWSTMKVFPRLIGMVWEISEMVLYF